MAKTPLPEGDNGIARNYPGDVGIAGASGVLFADGFETYTSASQLSGTYENLYQLGNLRIATEAANKAFGAKALEMTQPITAVPMYNGLEKYFTASDTVFVRMYNKLDLTSGAGAAVHNGLNISGNYPGAGTAPTGSDFFLAGFENTIYRGEASPGYFHAYVYHPEQVINYGDHWYSDGVCVPNRAAGYFGPDFVPIALRILPQNTWMCTEMMVKLNTPGLRDGRVAAWVDGVLIADWLNLRFRDVTTLKGSRLEAVLGSPDNTVVDHIWFDNIVAATSYIGPVFTGTTTSLVRKSRKKSKAPFRV